MYDFLLRVLRYLGDTSSLVFCSRLARKFLRGKKRYQVVTAKQIDRKLCSRLSFRYSLLSRPREIVFKNLVSRCRCKIESSGLIAETRQDRSQKVERMNSGVNRSLIFIPLGEIANINLTLTKIQFLYENLYSFRARLEKTSWTNMNPFILDFFDFRVPGRSMEKFFCAF